jgi:hypothetical protein
VLWVLDHLADIESDLSAIHRVDNMWSMPATRFLRLAERLVAYPGVMRARAEMEAAESGGHIPDRGTRPRNGTYTPQSVTPAAATLDPVLGSIISFGNSGVGGDGS